MNANEQIKMIHSALFGLAEIAKQQQAEIEAMKSSLVDKTENMQGSEVDKTQFLQGYIDLDDLEDKDSYEFSFHEVKAALKMLRQQQSEITKLKSEIEALKSGGEPVAWRYRWKNSKGQFITSWQSCVEEPITDDDRFYFEPLFTRPAKTLTEDEITKEIYQMTNVSDKTEECIIVSYEALQGFANSLLRKA